VTRGRGTGEDRDRQRAFETGADSPAPEEPVEEERAENGPTSGGVVIVADEARVAARRGGARPRLPEIDGPEIDGPEIDERGAEGPSATGPSPKGRRPKGPAPAGPEREATTEAFAPLPAWTDPPTGQVPRILLDPDHASFDDPEPSGQYRPFRGPTWRASENDWTEASLDLSDLVEEFTAGVDEALLAEPRSRSAETAPPSEEPTRRPGSRPSTSRPERPQVGHGPGAIPPRSFPLPQLGPLSPAEVAARVTESPVVETRPVPPVATSPDQPLAGSTSEVAASETTHAPRAPGRAGATRPSRDRSAPSSSEAASSPAGGKRSPLVATLTGLALAIGAVAIFYAGDVATLLLVAVAITAAAGEIYAALQRGGHHPATLVGLLATPVLVVGGYLRGPQVIAPILAVVVVFSLLWYVVGPGRSSIVDGVGTTLLGVVWVGVLGSFAGLLLDPTVFPDRHGLAFLVGAVVVTVGYDIGGYAVGARFGRHRLAPRVSPNKTYEGLAGGVVVAFVFALGAVARIHPWSLASAGELAVIVSVLAPLGDLVESAIKRDLALKDMGTLLPAHGGVLDRIDGMLLVVPAVYFLARLAHLG